MWTSTLSTFMVRSPSGMREDIIESGGFSRKLPCTANSLTMRGWKKIDYLDEHRGHLSPSEYNYSLTSLGEKPTFR